MSFFKNLFGKKPEANPTAAPEEPIAPMGSGPGDELGASDLQAQIEMEETSFVFEKVIWTHSPADAPQDPGDTLDLNFQKVTPAEPRGPGGDGSPGSEAPGYVSDAEGGGAAPAQYNFYEAWPAKWYVPELDSDAAVDPSDPSAPGGSPQDLAGPSDEESVEHMKRILFGAAGVTGGLAAPEASDSFAFGVEREMKESGEDGGSLESGPGDEAPAALEGIIDDGDAPAAGNVEFEWKVEEGESAPLLGQQVTFTATVQPAGGPVPGDDEPAVEFKKVEPAPEGGQTGGSIQYTGLEAPRDAAGVPGEQATGPAAPGQDEGIIVIGGGKPQAGDTAVPAAQNSQPAPPGEDEGIIIIDNKPGESAGIIDDGDEVRPAGLASPDADEDAAVGKIKFNEFSIKKTSDLAEPEDDGPTVLFEQKVMEGDTMTKLGNAGLGGPDTSELGGVEHEDDWETPVT